MLNTCNAQGARTEKLGPAPAYDADDIVGARCAFGVFEPQQPRPDGSLQRRPEQEQPGAITPAATGADLLSAIWECRADGPAREIWLCYQTGAKLARVGAWADSDGQRQFRAAIGSCAATPGTPDRDAGRAVTAGVAWLTANGLIQSEWT
jgi:hypothetical protein